jgi:hypothetical protein
MLVDTRELEHATRPLLAPVAGRVAGRPLDTCLESARELAIGGSRVVLAREGAADLFVGLASS